MKYVRIISTWKLAPKKFQIAKDEIKSSVLLSRILDLIKHFLW
jgi:uncharacterized protein YfbU (UPF0304 family)